MVGSVHGARLVGKAQQLRVLRGMVDSLARGHGGAIVVRGAAGTGKSILLRHVAAEAANRLDGQAAVVSVAASEAERNWPYSGLHLVLSGLAGSDAAGEQAGRIADVLGDIGPTSQPHDLAMRLLALLSQVESPVLALVDDADILDHGSQEVLGFVARRLRALPVALVLAGDPARNSPPILDGVTSLQLTELDHDDATELLEASHSDLTGAVAAELAFRVGGNPRVLLDVAAHVPAEQRAGQVPLDRYLRTSGALQELVLPGLAELDAGQRLGLLVAAVNEDRRIGPVLVALQDAPESVEWILKEHVDVSDGTYRLRSPVVGSIIWRASGLSERAQAHERLALAYEGLDSDAALWHRAQAAIDPNEKLAGELQRCAGDLLGRGEIERAFAFARESVRLTAVAERRVDRILQAGELALRAGWCIEAVQAARERARMAVPAGQNADLILLETRARLVGDDIVPTDLIDAQAALLAGSDPDRAARFWLVAAWGFADRHELSEAKLYLSRIEGVRPELSESTLASYQSADAWVAALSGEHERAAHLLESDSGHSDVRADAERCVRHAMVLTRLERFDEARRLLQVVTEQRRFGDAAFVVCRAYSVTATLEIRSGRLTAAKSAFESLRRFARGGLWDRGIAAINMIRAYALMGDASAALECYELGRDFAHQLGDWWAVALLHAEAGSMYLHLNQLDEAMSNLERARDAALVYEDPSVLATEPDFIEACVRRGFMERALSALAAFEVRVARIPTTWGRHTLSRCRALVAEGEESLWLFAEAVGTEADQVSPLELAWTQVCYGERLRRLGRRTDATEWLHRAIVRARECGAGALATRAEAELGTGVHHGPGPDPTRRGGLAQLTSAELRVARLVAGGRRNREIAAQLYVSVRTVETHLGRVYRKLGVRSRAELASLVVANDVSSKDSADG